MSEATLPNGSGAEPIVPLRLSRIAVVVSGADGVEGGDRDRDAALLTQAGALAAAAGASLSLCAVVEQADLGRVAAFCSFSRDHTEARVGALARERLEQFAARHPVPVVPSLHVQVGKTHVEVIRHVLDHGVDLLLKEAERLPDGVLASADQHLLRKCPCTIWLARRASPAPVRVVLATVDVEEGERARPDVAAELNRRIVTTAAGLAAYHRAPLHLLHAWHAPGAALVRRWAARDDAADRYVVEVRRQRDAALQPLLALARRVRGPGGGTVPATTPHLIQGAPRDVVPAQVRAQHADLVVMGTIARTGVPGFLIGNTAEDVLNSLDCAVVTVKPPGYESPVRF